VRAGRGFELEKSAKCSRLGNDRVHNGLKRSFDILGIECEVLAQLRKKRVTFANAANESLRVATGVSGNM
jgi:hypothetical protein